MTNPWKKASEAFRTRTQEIKHKIHQSKPIQWLLKQKWFRWMTSHQAAILTILAITAFASYALLIRKELTVGENQGNIKFVAS